MKINEELVLQDDDQEDLLKFHLGQGYRCLKILAESRGVVYLDDQQCRDLASFLIRQADRIEAP